MNVKEMRLLLKGLPGNMQVMLDASDGVIVSVCGENSQVVEVPILDEGDYDDLPEFEDSDDPVNDFHEYDLEEEDEEETIEILLLVPCNHAHPVEEGELNSQPELN